MKKLIQLVMFTLLLTACSSKTSDKTIREDFNESFRAVNIGGVSYLLDLENIKITKRDTDGKNDIIYFDYSIKDANVRETGSYWFRYYNYSQGGWTLEAYDRVGEAEISFIGDDILFGINEMDDLRIPDERFDSISYFSSSKNEDGTLYISYEVERNDLITKKSGILTQGCRLLGLNRKYEWVCSSDTSQLDYLWNINGEWYGESFDNEYYLTIDKYDHKEGKLYISYLREVYESGFVGKNKWYDNIYTDLAIDVEVSYDDYYGCEKLSGNLTLKSGDTRIIIYSNKDVIIFDHENLYRK